MKTTNDIVWPTIYLRPTISFFTSRTAIESGAHHTVNSMYATTAQSDFIAKRETNIVYTIYTIGAAVTSIVAGYELVAVKQMYGAF